MRPDLIALGILLLSLNPSGSPAEVLFPGQKKSNNFVTQLLDVSAVSGPSSKMRFSRPDDGWIMVSIECQGKGALSLFLDKSSRKDDILVRTNEAVARMEAMRSVMKGEHTLEVECSDGLRVDKLVVKAIPELIHCGLGFNPEIKSYGNYDLEFLAHDVLPNITTLIVPNHINLPVSVTDAWHRLGKKFVAEVGINSQAKTAQDHMQFWTSFYEKTPFLDGIIINEFIVNRPVAEWVETMTPERQARMEQERHQYEVYSQAIAQMRADDRFQGKMLYAYIGGSGKKLNQEIIGTNFVRTIIQSGYRIALERYLHEMSSLRGSEEALQLFREGVSDWEAREPGVKRQLVLAFGLFSMPPGGLNKQPNVDYHVWMDQQMHLAANDPALRGVAGLTWWTSVLADEETVRFVGKLYRHYCIAGETNRMTKDPLFLAHIENADFERGTEGWRLRPAEEGSISVKSFPRYGRIEGRYMGLGRPADPEHIGDTFLVMKKSAKSPNTFSQTIKNLEPGRLYSMKMFSCDHRDLTDPKARKIEEANKFTGSVVLEGVDLDVNRSFQEMYSSNPEPPIPVWITYHWFVFRAKSATARLTVSDWPQVSEPGDGIGLEQTFNFLEIQPYHE